MEVEEAMEKEMVREMAVGMEMRWGGKPMNALVVLCMKYWFTFLQGFFGFMCFTFYIPVKK
jgi:hypothetical protein